MIIKKYCLLKENFGVLEISAIKLIIIDISDFITIIIRNIHVFLINFHIVLHVLCYLKITNVRTQKNFFQKQNKLIVVM